MKKQFSIWIFTLVMMTSSAQVIHNDITGSCGQSDTCEGLLVSWTVGECIIEHYCNTDCMISQGFHQTYYKILKIDDNKALALDIKIYPNPAVDRLNIDLSNLPVNKAYRMVLHSLKGDLLHQEVIHGSGLIRLNLRSFQDEFMLLKITDLSASRESSFKIIKVNH